MHHQITLANHALISAAQVGDQVLAVAVFFCIKLHFSFDVCVVCYLWPNPQRNEKTKVFERDSCVRTDCVSWPKITSEWFGWWALWWDSKRPTLGLFCLMLWFTEVWCDVNVLFIGGVVFVEVKLHITVQEHLLFVNFLIHIHNRLLSLCLFTSRELFKIIHCRACSRIFGEACLNFNFQDNLIDLILSTKELMTAFSFLLPHQQLQYFQ
jgi:hypothetical protein